MIDMVAARNEIAARCLAALGDQVTIYPAGITGQASLPAVALGMPRWESNVQPCMDLYTWPLAVVVARPGSNDPYVITTLDQLWTDLAGALMTDIENDQTLGGICKAAEVTRADAGYLTVQGVDQPAQTIMLETYG